MHSIRCGLLLRVDREPYKKRIFRTVCVQIVLVSYSGSVHRVRKKVMNRKRGVSNFAKYYPISIVFDFVLNYWQSKTFTSKQRRASGVGVRVGRSFYVRIEYRCQCLKFVLTIFGAM